MSRKQAYAEKQAKKALFAVDAELASGGDNFQGADADVRDAAMGKGGKLVVGSCAILCAQWRCSASNCFSSYQARHAEQSFRFLYSQRMSFLRKN